MEHINVAIRIILVNKNKEVLLLKRKNSTYENEKTIRLLDYDHHDKIFR